ncbi:putative galacturonosyltransferase-like 5 [Symbiodinium microadriaticum]|uniref:Putative galacturonosyltransferase-like 5 n=1 Tax=Symbiodinium microadriaticum TaxID=2951 RepID=A0A1Q9CJL0_SYMMI|nr:putative galacturonosyltransferase-like 5 [Symbiodinium microadriaticum]
MRSQWLTLGLGFLILGSVWLTSTQISTLGAGCAGDRGPAQAPVEELSDVSRSRTVHLCICSDDPDFRPAVVAIRSAVSSSPQSHRFVFHFVTTLELSTRFLNVAKLQLPGIRVEVHADEELQQAIQSRILFRKGAGRKVLASPFNFAPFYLPHFLLASSQTFHTQTERLIYFDADIVILGDLAQLFDMDMQGKVCAAVPYCHQRLKTYINFDVLHSLGHEGIDPDSCIANRGLLLIDVQVWSAMKITESIENWLDVYRASDVDLWVGGMSQPPWLLAMNGNYTRLSDDWNCNSLGRHSMIPAEAAVLRNLGFEDTHLQELHVEPVANGLNPYVVLCSSTGKILHYNGAMKPWLLDSDTISVPVCTLPESLRAPQADQSKLMLEPVLAASRALVARGCDRSGSASQLAKGATTSTVTAQKSAAGELPQASAQATSTDPDVHACSTAHCAAQ